MMKYPSYLEIITMSPRSLVHLHYYFGTQVGRDWRLEVLDKSVYRSFANMLSNLLIKLVTSLTNAGSQVALE